MSGLFCGFDPTTLDMLATLNGCGDASAHYNIVRDGSKWKTGSGEFTLPVRESVTYKACDVSNQQFDSGTASANGSTVLYLGNVAHDDLFRLRGKHFNALGLFHDLLLKELTASNWTDNICKIKSSISCIFIEDGEYYLFRDEKIPMYIDDKMTISSHKFDGASLLPPNKVFVIDFERMLVEDTNFQLAHV